MTELRGLILDWGGVLTSDLSGAMTAWANEEQVDLEQFANVMREWLGREGEIESFVNPVHALERGEIEVPHFEQRLAEGLTQRLGRPISPAGLIGRLFQNFTHAPDMTALVRRAKVQGISTALLSNSWAIPIPTTYSMGCSTRSSFPARWGCASQKSAFTVTRWN